MHSPYIPSTYMYDMLYRVLPYLLALYILCCISLSKSPKQFNYELHLDWPLWFKLCRVRRSPQFWIIVDAPHICMHHHSLWDLQSSYRTTLHASPIHNTMTKHKRHHNKFHPTKAFEEERLIKFLTHSTPVGYMRKVSCITISRYGNEGTFS